MANLRTYQRELNAGIRSAWAEGHRVVMGVLPTGGGKTVCMGDIAIHHDGWGCAIAHRHELVSQISRSLASEGIMHKIIGSDATVSAIQRDHYKKFDRSWLNQKGRTEWAVASVDTIVKRPHEEHFKKSTLAIEDEGHHALRANKWGKVFNMFSATCLGLLLTATPIRADGMGLGRSFDGIVDMMIEGPGMRWMIENGFLTDYDVFCPEVAGLDFGKVKTTASGELSDVQIAELLKKNPQIIGDVVRHYLEHASGKLGITFAANIDEATKIAAAFNAAGVPAEVVSSNSTTDQRRSALERFEKRELLQLVNVDLFGEGFDLPAIEVVSMARPTASLSLFYQQWGRALRLMISPVLQAAWDTYSPAQRLAFIKASGKPRAIIIDHVGNLLRHLGPPDKDRVWSLARRQRGGGQSDAIPLRSCAFCHKPFERIKTTCPYCRQVQPPPDPTLRGSPKLIDGDLHLLSPEVLEAMRKGAGKLLGPAYVGNEQKGTPAEANIIRTHAARNRAQQNLRYAIACWAGLHNKEDDQTRERRFFHTFKLDVLSAFTLGRPEAEELLQRVTQKVFLAGAVINGLPFPDDVPKPQVEQVA